MGEEKRAGHYQDKHGNWHKDRRKGGDRRLTEAKEATPEDRRHLGRRITDELLERDHQAMIEEALEDFAAEHDGHL